jgi:hypothetical protein
MRICTLTILLVTLLSGFSSFKTPEDDGKDKGAFSAMIDGKAFQLKPEDLMHGILVNKSGSMDGRSSKRTVINVTFSGPSYDRKDGTPFNETVQFEMNYETQKLGEPAIYSVALQYASTDYSMIKEQSKVHITQITWEPDHKHFRMAADFDCKMRSWGYPMDNKKDVSLKGKMNNIRITVPSWIAKS